MTHPIRRAALVLSATLAGLTLWADAADERDVLDTFIVVQSTTSTQNSGLYDHLLPLFFEHSGIEVRIVAVGTGQAIRNATNGDGDVLLVHARAAEQEFVAAGHGIERFDLMYNDFVIVGPSDDPAGVLGSDEAVDSLRKIASTQSTFASRGDDSGTHKAERALWIGVDIDIDTASGSWYRETGSGMGATLNVAVGSGAYALTDRASWISFGNKQDHTILVEGDPALFNQYGVTLVNADKHPNVKTGPGRIFIDWLLSDTGQAAIAAFRVDAQQLFFPNAHGS